MRKAFTTLLYLFILNIAYSQQKSDSYKFMFYNVENLFDTYDDSLKNDNEFLPEGERYWNNYKYYTKLNQIYKVIVAIGEWNPPAIIGLCEIENRKVLNDLVNNTPLVKFEYKIIHKESPDKRGIDVGFLYREKLFKPLSHEAIAINFLDSPDTKTRDILYVKGKVNKKDTVHIFINHWPSRWGGQLESENRRLFAASVLRSKIDSIFDLSSESNIIITGDFNDYPDNKSMQQILKANKEFNQIINSQLYNLSSHFSSASNIGTTKYQGNWGILDQFIVSGYMLDYNNIYTGQNNTFIYSPDFLLEPDDSYFGFKPFRTYRGLRYNGGYSDHLPTYIIINFNK